MYIIYSKLINCISVISLKLSPKTREALLNVAVMGLSLICIVAYCNKRIKTILHYKEYALLLATLLLVLLLFASIDRIIKAHERSAIRPVFWIGWFCCYIFMLFSALFFYSRDAYLMWSILGLTIFPMLFMIWHERGDLQTLFSVVAKSMVRTLYIFAIFNIAAAALIKKEDYILEYLGVVANPNSNGLIVMPFFVAALYLLLTEKKNNAAYILAIAISIVFAVISKTRATELAMMVISVAAVFMFFRHKNDHRREWTKRGVVFVLALTVLFSLALGYTLMQLDDLDLNAYAESVYDEICLEVQSDENLLKVNDYSSGRLILWMAYSKAVGFMGHGNPNGELLPGHPGSKWAHNNALDIWYASGFPAFAGYLLWLLAGWKFVFRCIFGKCNYRKEYMLTSLAFIGYFVEAMLEITLYPMTTGIMLLCFLTLTPVAFKEEE